MAPEQTVPTVAQLLGRFGDIVEQGRNSFSALVWDGELENPVVVTLTVNPPAFAAAEMLVTVRATAVEGLIKQRSAAILLPRIVAALEHLGTEPL